MRTLCIDVGGSGIKGTVYDATGAPQNERIRIETPRPAGPEAVVATIVVIAAQSSPFERISCGFPGVVLDGVVETAPNLDGDWKHFDLAAEVTKQTSRPVRIANDADVQGLAVIEGRGVELVLTLGTGMGSGLYVDGRCAWNLELGHHPFDKKGSYEDRVCDAERKRIGVKKWKKRVEAVTKQVLLTFNCRKLYLGGGNAARLSRKDFPPSVSLIDNAAGMLGGLKLWSV